MQTKNDRDVILGLLRVCAHKSAAKEKAARSYSNKTNVGLNARDASSPDSAARTALVSHLGGAIYVQKMFTTGTTSFLSIQRSFLHFHDGALVYPARTDEIPWKPILQDTCTDMKRILCGSRISPNLPGHQTQLSGLNSAEINHSKQKIGLMQNTLTKEKRNESDATTNPFARRSNLVDLQAKPLWSVGFETLPVCLNLHRST